MEEFKTSIDKTSFVILKKERKIAIIVLGVVIAVLIISVILLGALVIIPLSEQKVAGETTSPPPVLIPVKNLPPGSTCSSSDQCVPGCFCNGDKLCANGNAIPIMSPCTGSYQCALGSYCSGNNYCMPGVGWTMGGPCGNNSDCALGYECVSGACAPSSLVPTPSSCTGVPVYNLLANSTITSNPHINSSTTIAPNDQVFLNNNPIFYGCDSSGAGKIPIYIWTKTSINDVFYSTSATTPFTAGTLGYALGNSGNPIFYLYQTQYTNTIPVYKLQGFSFQDAQNYHCLSTGLTTIVQKLPQDKSITYTQNVTDTDYGLLGYAPIL
jgi:hypothetical protein